MRKTLHELNNTIKICMAFIAYLSKRQRSAKADTSERATNKLAKKAGIQKLMKSKLLVSSIEEENKGGSDSWGMLLLRRVIGKSDALCDVALQHFNARFDKNLFSLIKVSEWVNSLSYSVGLSNH